MKIVREIHIYAHIISTDKKGNPIVIVAKEFEKDVRPNLRLTYEYSDTAVGTEGILVKAEVIK